MHAEEQKTREQEIDATKRGLLAAGVTGRKARRALASIERKRARAEARKAPGPTSTK